MSNANQQRMLSHAVIAAGLIACTSDIATADQSAGCNKSIVSYTETKCPILTGCSPDVAFAFGEIWLADFDGTALTNHRRVTDNYPIADYSFNGASPDGKGTIVFNSNRLRDPNKEPLNTSDLFLMREDGSHQRFLTRGSSASWSPDGK